jgi:hypothetical protein
MGVVPSIVRGLLAARKEVKGKMASLNGLEHMLANQLQLAFKVSANSAYGILTSFLGPLAMPECGMCVTAVGRKSIRKVAEIMRCEHNGRVIYGDTDSAFVVFKNIAPEKLDEWCTRVAKAVKDIYRKLLCGMIDGKSKEWVETTLVQSVCTLCSGALPLTDYAVTSSLKNIDDMKISVKSDKKVCYGSYTISRINEDEKKRATQMRKKGATSELDFYRASLPNHVQLALTMRERGQAVESGARLTMVFVRKSCKLEELEYFQTFCNKKRMLDTLHYLSLLMNPAAELFGAYFGREFESYFQVLYRAHAAKLQSVRELSALTYSVTLNDPFELRQSVLK